MGAKNKALAAGTAAKAAKENSYVQRLIHDDDLRDNIRQAYVSARDAYDRLDDKGIGAVLDDKRLQKDLSKAADALRDAGVALREPDRKGGGLFRKLMLVSVAGGLALALSEGLRKKVLDALFGAEEEFEYTATTTTSSSSSGGTSNGTTAAAGTTGDTAPAGSTS